ncbi:MAG TPA: methyltransferase domain-containing protein [Candidatus Eisenbacteria bacterium]|nr:methyltransferase domain-containing protein [Candidatus Eisenbacteria bacterium]
MARRREWFDDDVFWRELHPFLFPETSYQAAARNLPALLRLAKPKGRAVLDLCCGPGRFAIPLAKRGFAVTGVDRTRYFLTRGQARARKARARVEWVRSDMRDFVRPGAFDLALSMFTSFGYFDDKAEDLAVLRNIRASLRPGGALVIEVMGKEILARIWQEASCAERSDGTRLFQRRRLLDDWTRIQNEWTLVRASRAKTYRFHHTIYSGQELRDRLEAAGFTVVRLCGSLSGDPYDLKAVRLVAVARTPGRPTRRPERPKTRRPR